MVRLFWLDAHGQTIAWQRLTSVSMRIELETALKGLATEIINSLTQTMAKFTIEWSKTYIRTGVFEIEADNESAAELLGHELLGDQVGSYQYLALQDIIEVCPIN